ncbi:hypothetical protein [Candidatus Villigracilis affinis]|uniref:hypothetical protein n=1 Tax=Candidatus Villigracilis affinis TaxID=3140682 RepID=UPI001DF43328|nr:hypothetical protein [Anaerolineales bacterium]
MNTILMLQGSITNILQNWNFFLSLWIIQGAFTVLTLWLMSDALLDKDVISVLSFLGGILGFTLFSLVITIGRIKPSPALGIAITVIALLILIWQRHQFRSLMTFNLAGLIIFFLFILLLRLIFIRDLLVPAYSDSVLHLQIVRDLLNPEQAPQAFYRLSSDPRHYYHVGFHSLAAFLSGGTSTSAEQTILLLGQYFQSLAIIAVFPLTRILTKNSLSAWAVMSIAGLILTIPAYASNWGKYPSIASLTGIIFGLTLFIAYCDNKAVLSKKLYFLTFLAVLSATSLHSRSLFVFLLAIPAIFLYSKSSAILEKLEIKENNTENKMMIIVLWAIMLHVLVLALKFPDSQYQYFPSFLFLILTIFSFYSNFALTWIVISFFLTMGLSILIPLPLSFLPVRYSSLFDRPFLIVFFYLPASFLIWQGIEGGLRLVAKNTFESWRQRLFTIVFFICLSNAIFIQNHQPSDCCIFMDDNDLFSFHWMKNNIPEDALIGIAATGKTGSLQPADGGAWVELFTGISTRKIKLFNDITNHNISWNIDFASEGLRLCKEGVDYFYVDGLQNSFDEYTLVKIGSKYEFGLGNIKIYHLECKDGIP